MTDGPYLVQCTSGKLHHILEAIPGSELEKKCMARREAGFRDALPLDADDCVECVDERRTKLRQDYDMLGCPGELSYNKCATDCASCAERRAGIPDSIYENQVQGLAFAA